MKLIKASLLAAALGFNAVKLFAQDPPPPADHSGPPVPSANAQVSPRTRHLLDLLAALDTNHDGVIDAKELANAPDVLQKLEHNRPGNFPPNDMGPQPRQGRGSSDFRRPGPGPGGPGDRGPAEFDQRGPGPGPDGPLAPPMPPARPDAPRGPGFAGTPGAPADGGPGAAGMRMSGIRHRGPRSPLMEALDTNHDGVLDADEIANATANLRKLDKNNDGKLTEEELHLARPQRSVRMQRAPADGPRPGPEGPQARLDRGADGAEDGPLPPPPPAE